MMNRQQFGIVVVAASVLGSGLWLAPSSLFPTGAIAGQAQAASEPQATPSARIAWEYESVDIDVASLTAKLNDLGHDGWEVTSVVAATTRLDTTMQNAPTIHTERVTVVAKRKRL
jgi:hypothetical protein